MATLFHKHLNNLNKLIEFTIEHEKNNKLHFNDVMIEKGQILKTSIYRKPTPTDRYISFTSHHHPRILTETVKYLYHRPKRICDQEYIEPELKHLTEVF